MLDLIKNININVNHASEGEIAMHADNKKLIREIEKEVKKESDCTQEAGAAVEGIRRETSCSPITIKIQCANNKPRVNTTFEQQSEEWLIKKCDEEAKRKCKELIENESCNTVKCKGVTVPAIKQKILDKNINVLIRELDAMESGEEVIKEKANKHE